MIDPFPREKENLEFTEYKDREIPKMQKMSFKKKRNRSLRRNAI